MGLAIRICSGCGDANALAFQNRKRCNAQVQDDMADITIAVLSC